MIDISAAGNILTLLPGRAVLWPERSTLILADIHLGKGAVYRSRGIPIPAGGTRHDLSRLRMLMERHTPRRLLVLGDLFHARESMGDGVLEELFAWRSVTREVAVELVAGNHDRHAGAPPQELGIHVHAEELVENGLRFTHIPGQREGVYTLAGHVHPVVKVGPRSSRRMRVPCFWERPGMLTFPAFGAFTGGHEIMREKGDRVWAAGDDQVILL